MILWPLVIVVNYHRFVAKKIDPDDLVDSAGAAEIIGRASGNVVSVYRRRYDDFPTPVIDLGKCVLWLRSDVEAWHKKHPARER